MSISKSSKLFCEPQVGAKDWKNIENTDSRDSDKNRYNLCFQYLMILNTFVILNKYLLNFGNQKDVRDGLNFEH